MGFFLIGHNCSEKINFCASQPCKNGGKCTSGDSKPICTCIEPYSGDLCETEITACSSGPCLNDGVCHPMGKDQFQCICPPGVGGSTCDLDILDECDKAYNPCRNGGSCRNRMGQ